MDDDVDLLTVSCGKEYCLDKWLNHIKTLSYKIPIKKWIIVNNSDAEFANKLKQKIKEKAFSKKFNYIIATGPGMFKPPKGVNWRSHEVCIGKHRSTGESFTLGFKLCTAKYVYTLDDDVIPPESAFTRLYNKIKQNDHIGAIAGVYFNNSGWDTGNPWRTPSQLKRTVVASIDKQHWHPAMIDEYWNRGVVESGFLGTGCTMYNREDVMKCLPMKTIPKDDGLILGPDGEICQSLREKCNKKIYVDAEVLCEHWETSEKEAGVGCSNFLKSKFATDDIILFGSFGDLTERSKSFVEARKLAEKLKLKMILVWPRNKTSNWKWVCPWYSDTSIKDVVYFHENEELKKFKIIKNENRKQKKVFDEVYFKLLNSGKYRKIYNLLDTSEQVENHTYMIDLCDKIML
jgi:hypothetical protein